MWCGEGAPQKEVVLGRSGRKSRMRESDRRKRSEKVTKGGNMEKDK